jgi:hypothetical protein
MYEGDECTNPCEGASKVMESQAFGLPGTAPASDSYRTSATPPLPKAFGTPRLPAGASAQAGLKEISTANELYISVGIEITDGIEGLLLL